VDIVQVPESLRPPPGRHYPPHTKTTIEQEFYCFATGIAQELRKPSQIYLPILWTAVYQNESKGKWVGYRASRTAQNFVNDLNPAASYFTVVECDDGCYEQLPPNVLVFGACGVGDVAIPLCSSSHYAPIRVERSELCFFAGNIECGGPEPGAREAGHSSWDPNGPGARIRRAMFRGFNGQPGCVMRVNKTFDKGAIHGFVRDMTSCRFALCPRGYGRTSFRLFEAMDLGAVPVYIYDEPWTPFSNELDWNEFCIMCPEAELPGLYDRLRLIDAATWTRMQKRGRDVYHAYFTLGATCQRILEHLYRMELQG
jgi:hypothetical protein